MATVNLGRIKPVFRGAYNSSTAYVVDDIVTDSNETFICILASTGNATSNATYWTKLAAKGTDGTDVGTTLTTQGDILYRDGSGLQRLAKGTAAQVLKMNTAANAPEWGTLSSDYVKLAEVNQSSDTTAIELQQFITSTYKNYKIFINNILTVNEEIWCRAMTGTNTEYSQSNYYGAGDGYYKQYSGGSSGNQDQFSSTGNSYMRFTPGFYQDEDSMGWAGRIIIDVTGEANKPLTINGTYYTPRYTNAYVYHGTFSNSAIETTKTWTGLKLYMHSGGNIKNMDITIYGMKK